MDIFVQCKRQFFAEKDLDFELESMAEMEVEESEVPKHKNGAVLANARRSRTRRV